MSERDGIEPSALSIVGWVLFMLAMTVVFRWGALLLVVMNRDGMLGSLGTSGLPLDRVFALVEWFFSSLTERLLKTPYLLLYSLERASLPWG